MKANTTDRDTASVIPHHPAVGFSRRDFCFTGLLASLGSLSACRPRRPAAESELGTVQASFDRLGSTQPNLPGVKSLLTLDPQRLGQGFTDADLEILTGALYLEAKRKLEDTPATRREITEADVKAVLSKPIDVTPYGRDFFARVLNDARARLAADPAYRGQLEDAQAAARPKKCLGDTPRWICWGMIAVVVIGILLVL